MPTYPLAEQGVYRTVQGEGILTGVPMVFVRLAGCSVGCLFCDTNYRVVKRVTVEEVVRRVRQAGLCEWTWVTGGEPMDHDLRSLVVRLKDCGHVAVATSGSKRLTCRDDQIDFLSVSPHGLPDNLEIMAGSQINLVPGLNGLRLSDWDSFHADEFRYRYVTPCAGKPETLAECLEWVNRKPGWRLGCQSHKSWGLP